MNIVIIQPSFLPWRGFFDLVRRSDLFVHYDDVLYSKHSWRNRNRIVTSAGSIWMTVPIETKGCIQKKIYEVRIAAGVDWRGKLLGQISTNYRRAPFFESYYPGLERVIKEKWEFIADLDIALFDYICGCLSLKRTTLRSKDLGLTETDPVRRLVDLCTLQGGTKYISGPSGKDYINDAAVFTANGIALEFFDYPAYPPYSQLYGGYDPYVSIIDTLFNVGDNAAATIWGETAGAFQS